MLITRLRISIQIGFVICLITASTSVIAARNDTMELDPYDPDDIATLLNEFPENFFFWEQFPNNLLNYLATFMNPHTTGGANAILNMHIAGGRALTGNP